MPLHLIKTPAGQSVALRYASSAKEAAKDNPHCTATLWEGERYPSELAHCPYCHEDKTSWDDRKIPQLICYPCNRRFSLGVRRDAPTVPSVGTTAEKIAALYRAGYHAYQIFKALGVSKQLVYRHLKRNRKTPMG